MLKKERFPLTLSEKQLAQNLLSLGQNRNFVTAVQRFGEETSDPLWRILDLDHDLYYGVNTKGKTAILYFRRKLPVKVAVSAETEEERDKQTANLQESIWKEQFPSLKRESLRFKINWDFKADRRRKTQDTTAWILVEIYDYPTLQSVFEKYDLRLSLYDILLKATDRINFLRAKVEEIQEAALNLKRF